MDDPYEPEDLDGFELDLDLDLDDDDDELDDDDFDSLDDLEQEVFFRCPWCAETVSALVELSDAAQSYIEDCEVCCRPMTLHVWRSGRRMRVEARAGT